LLSGRAAGIFSAGGLRKTEGCVATVVWGVVVAFTLALALYTIRALKYPFDGIVQVTPQAFELVLDKIEAGGR